MKTKTLRIVRNDRAGILFYQQYNEIAVHLSSGWHSCA
jgi:hypothetical protein